MTGRSTHKGPSSIAAATHDELLTRAEIIAGGTRALSRLLCWPTGAMSEVRKGTRPLPPYRSAQLAELTGEDVLLAIWSALREQARGDAERAFWDQLAHTSSEREHDQPHSTFNQRETAAEPDPQGTTDRLIASILSLFEAGERTRYARLEERTGVPAGRWKSVMNRKQQATLEMVQGWARVRPDLALWLLTGDAATATKPRNKPSGL